MECHAPRRLHNYREEHYEGECDGDKNFPAKAHDLIVTIAWERGTNPEEKEQHDEHFGGEPEEAITEELKAKNRQFVCDREWR